MRLPTEWICEIAEVSLPTQEISERLTMAGFEVEETCETDSGAVLEIKVTPNRGDGLSAIGVARELAAAVGAEPVPGPMQVSHDEGEAAECASVRIEDPLLCPRYAARVVRDVRCLEAPDWMKRRLEAAGMRSVNGIVDVTNYVMLEMGQPLHAFDLDTLTDRAIVVRRAREGERIVTLDGVERALTPEMLLICDSRVPVAVAGIMGGQATEIHDGTRSMLLESAHFCPRSVRATSRALGLRTEASYRFERVVDPAGVVAAADRACELIASLGMGRPVPGVLDCYLAPAGQRLVRVRPGRVSEMLGYTVSPEEVLESLSRLGIVQADGGDPPKEFVCRIPSWRSDLTREIDLVEEVGRVLGYEHIPEQLPFGTATQGGDSPLGQALDDLRNLLSGLGMQEIVGLSLLGPSPFEDRRSEAQRVSIRTALSSELSGLRRSLLPSLLDALERNARRGARPLCFFEVGAVFSLREGEPREAVHAAGALAGPLVASGWRKTQRGAPADFYTVRGIVERVAAHYEVPDLTFRRAEDPRLHPGRSVEIFSGDAPWAAAGELHPELAQRLNVRERVLVFELDTAVLLRAVSHRSRFVPPSVFPAVMRDLAPRVPLEVPYEQVRQAIVSAESPILEHFELTDLFTGPPLPEGIKSLTFSFTFRSTERTLVEAEVEEALTAIRQALASQCGAVFPQ
jgi:phenylalanyl-tRNA synthetase beta chain